MSADGELDMAHHIQEVVNFLVEATVEKKDSGMMPQAQTEDPMPLISTTLAELALQSLALPSEVEGLDDVESEASRDDDEDYESEAESVGSEDGHSDSCARCKDGGALICCDECSDSYHLWCSTPPLTDVPKGKWSCPACKCPKPDHDPERVLTWRWKELKVPVPLGVEVYGEWRETTESSGRSSRSAGDKRIMIRKDREMFVKWKYRPYLSCEWVEEVVLEVWFPHTLRGLWRRMKKDGLGPRAPPQLLYTFPMEEEECEKSKELQERYFQFGVHPEWLKIQRICDHKVFANGVADYQVKWQGLDYDQNTWERDDFCMEPTYKDKIKHYWLTREKMTGIACPATIRKKLGLEEERVREEEGEEKASSRKRKRNSKKKSKAKRDTPFRPSVPTAQLKEKLEEQPEYMKWEGGGRLHSYQLEGLNWLRHSFACGLNTILADEMGLGKTIQTIAFLYSLYKEGHAAGPFLVTAPLSTVKNWEREFVFWAPELYILAYSGNKESREVIRDYEFFWKHGKTGKKNKKTTVERKRKFQVLLTSYELVCLDKAHLKKVDWSVLVVDEAHRLKNDQSKFFRCLSEYKIESKVLLTGTPLQNNMEELYHLLNFMSPHRFKNMDEFIGEFSEISKEDQIEKLTALLGPHMLRRLKADVLQGIPAKKELIVRVDLSPVQKKVYKYILTKNYAALNGKGKRDSVSLMNVVMDLKKCCNHPYLFPKNSQEAPKYENGAYEGPAMVAGCGKLMLLEKMLGKLKEEGHRVLLFSQMTKMMDILEDFLDYKEYPYLRIDGSLKDNARQDAIDRFNAPGAEEFVFLLSTKAGGLGINLATADTVIIYDADWNPHNDIQALSRAHRIGQSRKVMIYRFVTRNSVEEKIATVAKKKMILNHLVVETTGKNSGAKGPSISKQELEDVLQWGSKDLFQDGEEGNGGGASERNKKIIWDGPAVDILLERKDSEILEKEKEHWSNEYLQSFKVAKYAVQEEDTDKPGLVRENSQQQTDPDHWEKLLRPGYLEEMRVEEERREALNATLGRGKRQKRAITYLGGTTDSDETSSFCDSEEESEEDEDEESPAKNRRPRSSALTKHAPPPVSPIIAQVIADGIEACRAQDEEEEREKQRAAEKAREARERMESLGIIRKLTWDSDSSKSDEDEEELPDLDSLEDDPESSGDKPGRKAFGSLENSPVKHSLKRKWDSGSEGKGEENRESTQKRPRTSVGDMMDHPRRLMEGISPHSSTSLQ